MPEISSGEAERIRLSPLSEGATATSARTRSILHAGLGQCRPDLNELRHMRAEPPGMVPVRLLFARDGREEVGDLPSLLPTSSPGGRTNRRMRCVSNWPTVPSIRGRPRFQPDGAISVPCSYKSMMLCTYTFFMLLGFQRLTRCL